LSSSLFPEEKSFGHVYNGRYHLPLLPGEEGTKAGGDWAPKGLRRTTNLVGGISDTKALGIWVLEQTLIGLVRQPSLFEELAMLVHEGDSQGVNWRKLKEHPTLRKALSGTWKDEDSCIAGRARHAAGANEARQAGINRHAAWEYRGKTGGLIGTPEMQEQLQETERLLREAGLERMAGLSERVIRNTEVNAAGKFDDILLDRNTGELLIADLKTKATEFYTWLEVDAQLAVYARAQYMLTVAGDGYERGPAAYVSQVKGVVLHQPSDGGPARLRKADLDFGWETALLCREVLDRRSYGKSVARKALSEWPGENLPDPVDIPTDSD